MQLSNIEQSVAHVTEDDLIIRGYRQSELCGNLTYTEALFLTLRGRLPTPAETKVLDGVLTGMLAYELWTITGLIAPLKPEEAWPTFVASFMAGGRYAMFPQHCGEFILEWYNKMKEANLGIEEMAVKVAEECRRERRNIPGLGHDLYKKVDPRAQAVRKVAEKNGFIGEKTLLYEAIHAEFVKGAPKRADICINIDGRYACTLLELGFEPIEMSMMAVVSLTPGVLAHIVEQRRRPPKFDLVCLPTKYTGPPERELPSEFKRMQ